MARSLFCLEKSDFAVDNNCSLFEGTPTLLASPETEKILIIRSTQSSKSAKHSKRHLKSYGNTHISGSLKLKFHVWSALVKSISFYNDVILHVVPKNIRKDHHIPGFGLIHNFPPPDNSFYGHKRFSRHFYEHLADILFLW